MDEDGWSQEEVGVEEVTGVTGVTGEDGRPEPSGEMPKALMTRRPEARRRRQRSGLSEPCSCTAVNPLITPFA